MILLNISANEKVTVMYCKGHQIWNQTNANSNFNLIMFCIYDFVDLNLSYHQFLHFKILLIKPSQLRYMKVKWNINSMEEKHTVLDENTCECSYQLSLSATLLLPVPVFTAIAPYGLQWHCCPSEINWGEGEQRGDEQGLNACH